MAGFFMRSIDVALVMIQIVILVNTARRIEALSRSGHVCKKADMTSLSRRGRGLGFAGSLRMSSSPETLNLDVAVIGGGIAGSTISWLLQERHGLKVGLIDPRANSQGTWYPNYGEWRDEWHALSDRLALPELKECTTNEWEITDCFFGGSREVPMDEKTTLPRPYVRVDRIKMQALLRGRFDKSRGIALAAKLNAKRINNNLFDQGIVHHKDGTILTLEDGTVVNCKTLIDSSGLESRIVTREDPLFARGHSKMLPTGFQIAYGMIAHVDKPGPYDKDAMTLFDYRTSFLEDDVEWLKDGKNRPTFMYTMPLGVFPDGTHRIFFEETSLVGMGKRRLSFEECKKRCYKRLEYHGVKVHGVEEEEYCYIPMGGELPDLTQRIIGFGGAANMVHPSTGYHACRMLAASTDLAEAISKPLKAGASPDEISASAYNALWNEQNRGQRSFQAFGGDFLMQQPVDKLRGFFQAFFATELPVWAGFLAGWPGLPGNKYHETWNARLGFALSLFTKMPNDVRLAMILYSITHTLEYGPNTLLRSLTPTFVLGAGPSDPVWKPPQTIFGDEPAKEEARLMMRAFNPSATPKASALKSKTGVMEQPQQEVQQHEHIMDALPAPFN